MALKINKERKLQKIIQLFFKILGKAVETEIIRAQLAALEAY